MNLQMTQLTVNDLQERSLKIRRAKAEQRRVKVKALRDKGLSAPRIAEELGLKLRTVYGDFSILKREAETERNSDLPENTENGSI